MIRIKPLRLLRSFESWLATTDRAVVSAIDGHTNLIAAIVVLGLCVWGIVTQHIWFVIGIVGVGAAAYSLGATLSLVAAVVLTILSIHPGRGFNLTVTTTLFEFVGYVLVARLGFKHRQEQAALLQQRQADAPLHKDHVMPWHVSNDIRTSLAAVRFLLFPVHDEQNHHAVDQAVQELARLERLFQEMEDKKQTTDKQAPTHRVQ
ncbi:MAG: hypothetical protein K6T83_11010 [Alicyclobacillus sp.]|nr:hypothetical protein [Alicyclobacillus sp.]